jgi:excisionase family DNA binding protein
MPNVPNATPPRKVPVDALPPDAEHLLEAAREGTLDALALTGAPRCLSMDDAADALGVSRRTLDTLVHAGDVQSLKIGRRRVVPVRALEHYVERKLGGPGQ